jgi:hypothetical protein
LILAGLPCLFGCSSTVAYHPADRPDGLEFDRDIVDVYPGDIRQNLDLYTNIGVGWAGIIQSISTEPQPDGTVRSTMTFEHRYYDWQEEKWLGGGQLSIAPRGEGLFTTEAVFRFFDSSVSPAAVKDFASPGSLAIVYGVPQKVENGIVILKYRYLRVIPPKDFTISQFDYGRFDEPIRFMENPAATPKS